MIDMFYNCSLSIFVDEHQEHHVAWFIEYREGQMTM